MMPVAASSPPRYRCRRNTAARGAADDGRGILMKRMAALLAVAGLIASAVPATAGAKPVKCGGTHHVLFLPIPFC
jgi:hypothetical protein